MRFLRRDLRFQVGDQPLGADDVGMLRRQTHLQTRQQRASRRELLLRGGWCLQRSGRLRSGDGRRRRGGRRLVLRLLIQALQHQLPIPVARDRFDHGLNLELGVLNGPDVRLQLRRKLVAVLFAERLHPFLLGFETGTGLLELDLKEIVGGQGQRAAVAHVLVDEDRPEPLGHTRGESPRPDR